VQGLPGRKQMRVEDWKGRRAWCSTWQGFEKFPLYMGVVVVIECDDLAEFEALAQMSETARKYYYADPVPSSSTQIFFTGADANSIYQEAIQSIKMQRALK
jgi:hypothetical protein